MNAQNPVGILGVNFIEYTGPNSDYLRNLFKRFGFIKVGDNQGDVELYRQGVVNFFLNSRANTFAEKFHKMHGPSICSMGLKVENSEQAFKTAVERGARPFSGVESEKGALPFKAVYGIGDSLVYLLDENDLKKLYSDLFKVSPENEKPQGKGFLLMDHFTNNVPKGEMQKWADFYEKVFNFRETRYFDIKGKQTGLYSKVMRSPCNTFSIPINEPQDSKSQIQEYLDEYKGSGIQHVALLTPNIVETLTALKGSEIEFLTPPPGSYYEMLHERVPNVSEDLKVLQKNAILVDGDQEGYLLQIFTKNIIGPIFFEIIQRKNHSGFGEGNFQALFDAIERDQQQRGYL